jgi:probable phosphoglycerate mutase
MTVILLIRHGENNYTQTGKLAGWIKGVHLNEMGRVQATTLAENLATYPINYVYSSPLVRALETARPIAASKKLTVRKCYQVGEVRYGQWQGKSLKVLRKTKLWNQIQNRPAISSFPDGESIRYAQIRAVGAIEKIVGRHPKGCIVVVSHADVIKLILAHYLGLALDLYQRIVINTASISELNISYNGVKVIRINQTTKVSVTK